MLLGTSSDFLKYCRKCRAKLLTWEEDLRVSIEVGINKHVFAQNILQIGKPHSLQVLVCLLLRLVGR